MAEDVHDFIQRAQEKKLHEDSTWVQLGHYKKKIFSSDFKSQITSQNFFLSEFGSEDPEAELIETIKGYFEPFDTTRSEEHPQCRYPARYMWLESELDLPHTQNKRSDCNAFNEWANSSVLEDIDLVFVSGYFGNPASFFGHVIVKFQTPTLNDNNPLLDQTVNFGAVVPENENSIRYLWKGLTGGYESTYSDQHFFAINHMYSEKDLRDQWSYKLNISDEKKLLIVAHIWELLGFEFKYFFFNRNCGYYVADTFQLIIDKPLMRYGLPWAFPSSIFDNVSTIKNEEGDSIVKDLTFYPSRQTRFYQKYTRLSDPLKAIVQSSVKNGFIFNDDTYTSLSKQDKIAVLDALLDYNAYLHYKFKEKKTELKRDKQRLILERLALKEPSPVSTYIPPVAPHFGQRPSKLALGIGHHSKQGKRAYANFRGAYYDHLSLTAGRPQHSMLKMADLEMQWDAGDFTISRLTFVEIEKLGITTTGLPQDAGDTWHLDVGVYKRELETTSVQDVSVTGGYGKAYQLSSKGVGFVMLDTVGIINDVNMSYVSPRASVIYEFAPYIATQLTKTWGRESIEVETRFGASRFSDFRVVYRQEDTHELRMIAAYYF